MTTTAAMAALEQIARTLDPEAWGRVAATNPKLYDTRRAIALKRAAKVMIIFAPMLAEKDARIREMAMHALAPDQHLTDAHDGALAAEAALQLAAE